MISFGHLPISRTDPLNDVVTRLVLFGAIVTDPQEDSQAAAASVCREHWYLNRLDGQTLNYLGRQLWENISLEYGWRDLNV